MFTDRQLLWIAAGIGIGGYLIYNNVLPKIGHAINPVNQKNVFYQGTNAVGSALSGQKSWSLGSWVYDLLHPGESAAVTQTPAGAGDTIGG